MRRQTASSARTVGRASDVGPVGLRTEAPEECGPVTESIDLSGFEWYGRSSTCGSFTRMSINPKGGFRLGAALTEIIEPWTAENGTCPALIGVAPGAIAIRILDAPSPKAVILRRFVRNRTSHTQCTSVPAVQALMKQGVAIPITLDVEVCPDQRLIYAKLPQTERGRGR